MGSTNTAEEQKEAVSRQSSKRVVLSVVNNKVQTEPEREKPSAVNPNGSVELGQFSEVPRTQGFFFLITGEVQAPVEIRHEQGMYFYRTWDGQRGYELADNQQLVGPVNNILDLTSFKVKAPEQSAIPSMPDDSEFEAELNDAYALISKYEKRIGVLEEQLSSHPAKEKLQNALTQIGELELKLQNNAQRASVAEEELDEALSQIEQLKAEATKAAGSAELTPEFKNAVTKIKMLLLQTKIHSTRTESMELIDELIESLAI
jgi:outer membrane protein OmpA-like peptidoglycan-associated protein